MDDRQPNEVRLSRKGAANIPRVRPVHAPYPKRPRRPPPAADGLVEIRLPLPVECQKGVPGSHYRSARKRWIEDQKCRLRTDRRLSVLSFRYLDHNNSVLFTCRTWQVANSTAHDARGSPKTASHFLDARLDTKHCGTPRQTVGTDNDIAQSGEHEPSRTRRTTCSFPGLGGRAHGRSSIPSPVEIRPVELSTTERARVPLVKPVPRLRTAGHSGPTAECVIDLTLDPTGEEHPARWSTFRSGYMNISIPGFSCGSRILSPEGNSGQTSSISRSPAQVVRQRGDTPDVCSKDTDLTVCPSISANGAVHVCSVEDHRVPRTQLRQHGVLGVAHSTAIVEDEEEMLSVPPGCHPPIPGFTSTCGTLPLSLGSRDKPRRMLHGRDFAYIVTAHGIIDQVGTTSILKLDYCIRSPSLPFEELVDDACMLSLQENPLIVLGHAREQEQITLLSVERGQVPRHILLRRDRNPGKNPGVSAVTSMMSPLKFASGGYDHRVHLWDVAQDLSGASAVELAIKHASLVHSLLPIVDTSQKLVSVGADRDVPIYDLSAERVAQTLKTSCIPHHAHKTPSRFSTLLEVSNLETQFEIRDHRLPNQAVQRFGFLAHYRRSRFEKADSWSHFVVCGDRNGAVRLWDLRKVSTEVAFRQCFKDPVVQVVHSGSRLLACSKRGELACINFQAE